MGVAFQDYLIEDGDLEKSEKVVTDFIKDDLQGTNSDGNCDNDYPRPPELHVTLDFAAHLQ